ncbi:hypothetical protein PAXRUDRAFT_174530 [Paxillus rubicundulus Ve08.2h10]|uniref:Uncharacterized protein n=1 Tax=Paxillus rubicundulus Ve08.2h10 TaxID=930991 RepID=A0A0D0CUP6_9AGAM|nr:hypothetical protein PAXRUDRAFT_174530 [Paxillus rubicundulus Ve08.2h10]
MHTRHHSTTSPRKSSRHPSNSALAHSTPLSTLDQGIAVPSGAHSLAHELAVALMPDPAGGTSRLLAEEFGIEYDEGAEGIDDEPPVRCSNRDAEMDDELGGVADDEPPVVDDDSINDEDNGEWGSDDEDDDAIRRATLAQGAMEILAQNLASTDRFLAHLRAIDTTFALENLTSDLISGLNDTVRDREGQVRELISYDRDLKRIAGEVGGMDVLGDLDPLEEFFSEDEPQRQAQEAFKLESVAEDEEIDEGESSYPPSFPSPPKKPNFISMRQTSSPPSTISSSKPAITTSQQLQLSISTLNNTIPSMTHLRSHTASFLASLTIISEQSQVNSAATADAGRKIRLAKNQLAKWKTDTEGAERSRLKIEKWEAESVGRRDGRVVVDEHVRAFEKVIVDAGAKTRAIMAR